MKNNTKIYSLVTLLILTLIVTSCDDKTEDCSDKAIIGRYFPAYPGSYWNYHNSEGTITNWRIGKDFIDFDGKCTSFFSNGNYYISENIAYYSFQAQGAIAIDNMPIYFETIGKSGFAAKSFINYNDNQALSGSVTRFRKTIGTQTIALDCLNIFKNTLVVKEYDTLIPNNFYLDYFAKDVGLVLRERVRIDTTGNMDTIKKLWLKSYHLNKI